MTLNPLIFDEYPLEALDIDNFLSVSCIIVLIFMLLEYWSISIYRKGRNLKIFLIF